MHRPLLRQPPEHLGRPHLGPSKPALQRQEALPERQTPPFRHRTSQLTGPPGPKEEDEEDPGAGMSLPISPPPLPPLPKKRLPTLSAPQAFPTVPSGHRQKLGAVHLPGRQPEAQLGTVHLFPAPFNCQPVGGGRH